MAKIIVVDDEPGIRQLCEDILGKSGHEVYAVSSGLEALKKMENQFWDLVITDLKMPNIDGITLLSRLKKISPRTEVIVMTAYGEIETAVKAIKLGAYEYLLKPFDIDDLMFTVEHCLSANRLSTETEMLHHVITLYKELHQMTKMTDEKEMLQLILNYAIKFIRASSGSILLLDKEKQELQLITSVGLGEEIYKTVKLGERIAGRVAVNGEPLILHNGLKEYPQFSGVVPRTDIVSSMVLPLVFQNENIGVLCLNRVSSEPYLFSETELSILEIFTDNAASIINAFRHRKATEELSRLKIELVANISHELRTPLTAIGGVLELVSNYFPEDQLNPEIKKFISIIAANHVRLLYLIDNLLGFARLDRNVWKFMFVPADMGKIADTVRLNMEPLIMKKNLACEITNRVSDDLKINGDVSALTHVMTNLIDNAIKYTSAGGKIGVEIDKVAAGLQVCVWDTGVGIPDTEKSKIFDYFYRVEHSLTAETKGAGIGLSLVRDIIKSHHGKIWVESEPGKKGSRFYFVLPLSQSE